MRVPVLLGQRSSGISGQGSSVAVASPHHAQRRVRSQGCGGQYRGRDTGWAFI